MIAASPNPQPRDNVLYKDSVYQSRPTTCGGGVKSCISCYVEAHQTREVRYSFWSEQNEQNTFNQFQVYLRIPTICPQSCYEGFSTVYLPISSGYSESIGDIEYLY